MSAIQRRIDRHGGMQAIHVTPVTGNDWKVIGWQNVVACRDGTRIGLSLEDEAALKADRER